MMERPVDVESLEPWNKSKKNLKNKLVNIWWYPGNGEPSVYHPRARVVSVNLLERGVSIVTEDGINEVLEGGVIRTQVLGLARFKREKAVKLGPEFLD